MDNLNVDEAKVAAARSETASGARTPLQPAALLGVLIGFQDNGRTPLVIFAGQVGEGAVAARAAHDLHAAHIGREVVLVFENGDPQRPIIVGCIQPGEGWPVSSPSGHVEIEADGERMVVSAREQLVLRCGSASITLTRSGKVLIHGEYVSSRSNGLLRIRGGSVQIN
ncbi:MAG TPA: DUF6484 domain-containing protein [Steroidobacteraceae bacterium]